MHKRLIGFVLVLGLLLGIFPVEPIAAEPSKKMNIYAIYLDSNEKGDSVLLESGGEYLLIDMGTADGAVAVIRELKHLGVKHLSLMFSHLHTDHIGGTKEDPTMGLKALAAAEIGIDTVYMPAPVLSPYSVNFSMRNTSIEEYVKETAHGIVVYLNVGDQLRIGDANGQVIGPLNTDQLSPNQFTTLPDEESRVIRYENNCSLVVMFTCGNTKYLATGDIYGEESRYLVDKYGDSLRADIMKLAHHGIGTGNSTSLLAAVQPDYSFICNTAFTEVDAQTDRWRSYVALERATKYGMCYMIGHEKKNLIYHIVNDRITLYSGNSVEEGKKLTGWQYLYGADGSNRTHDMYYLDSNCRPYEGIKKIGTHYYNFTSGGRMDYGEFSESGDYLGWKIYSDGKRYYTLSKDKKYAYMSYGLSKVKGMYMYFDDYGYQVEGDPEEAISIQKIDFDYYAVDFQGELTISDWEDIDGFIYYFDGKGKMIRNKKYKINGKLYIFDGSGVLVTGDTRTVLYDFGSSTYAVRKDGTLVTGKCAEISGKKYYFDSQGVMQKNKIIQIGKKQYYFNKSGKMVCDREFTWRGKTYSSNKKGVLTEVKK